MKKIEWLHDRSTYFFLLIRMWMICECSRFDKELESYMKTQFALALHFYCRHGFAEYARLALTFVKADCDIRDDNGETPLFAACKMGHVKTVRLLLAAGANANMGNNAGRTPLHAVCGKYCPSSGEGFLRMFACELTQDDNADRILIDAEIIRLLVSAGADCTLGDGLRISYSPLSFVCLQGRVEVFNLFFAAMNGQWDMRDNNGWTPFHLIALGNHHMPMLQLLTPRIANFPIDKRSTWEPGKFAHLEKVSEDFMDFRDDYMDFMFKHLNMRLNPDFLVPAFLDPATKNLVETDVLSHDDLLIPHLQAQKKPGGREKQSSHPDSGGIKEG
jgi:ankyrin repeat protein